MEDAYWWGLLVLSTGVDDAHYSERVLLARGPYVRFSYLVQPPGSLILQLGWCRMSDRFCVWIGGTDNEQQALSYAITHSLGQQLLRPIGWVNATFASQAVGLAALMQADWLAEGQPPLLVIGHSYGAAVAPIIAFELLGRAPTQFDRVVSFAAPKIATRTVKDSLANLQFLRFVNPGDIVPSQPPPQALVTFLAGPAAMGGYPGGDYGEAGPVLQLSPLGGFNTLIGVDQTTTAWTQQFGMFLAGGGSFGSHFMRSYVDVIRPNLGLKGLPELAGWIDFPSLQGIDDDLRKIGL
jgi:hypothetical protein